MKTGTKTELNYRYSTWLGKIAFWSENSPSPGPGQHTSPNWSQITSTTTHSYLMPFQTSQRKVRSVSLHISSLWDLELLQPQNPSNQGPELQTSPGHVNMKTKSSPIPSTLAAEGLTYFNPISTDAFFKIMDSSKPTSFRLNTLPAKLQTKIAKYYWNETLYLGKSQLLHSKHSFSPCKLRIVLSQDDAEKKIHAFDYVLTGPL